jgi:hypothetical protein
MLKESSKTMTRALLQTNFLFHFAFAHPRSHKFTLMLMPVAPQIIPFKEQNN